MRASAALRLAVGGAETFYALALQVSSQERREEEYYVRLLSDVTSTKKIKLGRSTGSSEHAESG